MLESLKNFLFVVLMIISGFFIFQSYTVKKENKRLHTELIGKKDKIKFLNENVANLEKEYVDQAKLKQIWKNTADELGVDNNALKGRIKLLSNATYLIREKARKTKRSDIIYQGKRMKYIVNEIRFEDGPPVGYVLIFDDGRVVSKIYKHAIDVKTMVSRDEKSGKYDVLSSASYTLKSPSIKQEKKWFNVKHPLKITGGKAIIDPTEPVNTKKSFYFWNPKLNGYTNGSVSGPKLGVGVSLMSYGISKNDSDLKLLHLGVDYEKQREVGIFFTPATIRPLPKYLPNTHIGPGVRIDKEGKEAFIGVSVGF